MVARRVVGSMVGFVLAVGSASAQQRVSKPSASLRHQFSSITGFRELPDGRVLVSDGVDQVLLRADLATGRIDTIGRTGPGPGEYRAPDQLLPLPGGATLLTDLGNGRLTIFDGAGKYRESLPIAQGGIGSGPLRLLLPRGADSLGRLYYQPGGPRPGQDSGAVIRWDRKADRSDTIARVRLPELVTSSSGGANNRTVRQRAAPYPLQEEWAVAPDGRLAVIRVDPYRVDWILPDGSRVTGQPIPAPPVPIASAEKAEYLDDVAANGLSVQARNVNGRMSLSFSRGRPGNGADREDEIDAMEWPKVKPPTTGTQFVAPDGTLWVERSVRAGAPRVYDLVGADGRVRRQVEMPAGRRVIGIGRRGIYARHLDQDGIAYLERYDLR